MKNDLRKIITTAILVVVAIILDLLVSVIPGLNLRMPMGGMFFGISMIPLVLIGLLFGLKYGLLGGFIYALYNFSFDYLIYLSSLAYLFSLSGWAIFGIIILDYLIPFMAFGLSGLFRKNDLAIKEVIYSVILVSGIRLISSTLSGMLLWGAGIKEAAAANNTDFTFAINIFRFVNDNLFLYSLIYNFIYIASTMIVSIIIYISMKKSLSIIYAKANQNITHQWFLNNRVVVWKKT